MLAVHHLAQRRAGECAQRSNDRENTGAAPAHVPAAGVTEQIGERIGRDSECARTNGDVWLQANEIEQQRRGEDRAAATDKPERETHETARYRRSELRRHCCPPSSGSRVGYRPSSPK